MEFTFKASFDDREFVGHKEIPDTVAECVELYGEAETHAQIVQRFKARLGHRVRQAMIAGKTDEEINEIILHYKPTLKEPAEVDEDLVAMKEIRKEKDPKTKKALIDALIAKMDAEEPEN